MSLTTVPKGARRWRWAPRFSLRAIIVATSIVGICFAQFMHISAQARRQRSAIEVLQHLGVQCWYDYQIGADGRVLPDAQQHLPRPSWLRNLAGTDCVASVVSVSASADFAIFDATIGILGDLPALKDIWGAHLNEAGIVLLERVSSLESLEVVVEIHLRPDAWQHLRHLTALRKLSVGGEGIDDDNLAEIGRLRGLKTLYVVDAPITGAGLSGLGELNELQALQLNQCGRLDDAGLKCLAELKELRSLSFIKSSVSDDAVEELWRHMPNLKAVYYSGGKSKTR